MTSPLIAERLDCLDFAKGYLIILVVIGHVFPESEIKTWIYSFHIPAFFVISGITSNYSRSFRLKSIPFLKKKMSSILLPIFVFELLGVLGRGIRFGFHHRWKGFFGDLATLYFNNTVDWFLFALFFCEWIIYISREQELNSKLNRSINIYIFSLVFGIFMPEGHAFTVLSWILLGTGFMGLGSIYEKKYLEFSRKPVVMAVCTFLLILNAVCSERISIYDHKLGNPFVFLAVGFAGILFIIGVSQYLKLRFIKDIGKCSLWIMGTHLPIRNIIYSLLEDAVSEHILTLLTLILVIVLNLGIKKILQNYSLRLALLHL